VPYLRDLYDDEILAFDAELDRFLDVLDERGLLHDSIVILAADHGEMFLEQDEIKHCRGLWDSVSRTPLVLWVPGVEGGRRIASPAENVDVVPTVVDLLGLPKTESEGFEGESLRGHLEGTKPASAPDLAFASQSTLRSVDDGRFKLILEIDSGRARLYDLAADPLEREDVSAREPAERDRLRKALDAWLAKNREVVGHAETIDKSNRVERKLRALGYLE
jgi:arylsulfatase A-like enzyme